MGRAQALTHQRACCDVDSPKDDVAGQRIRASIRDLSEPVIDVPADAPEPEIIAFVRGWLKLLAAGHWEEACRLIDEPNSYGLSWTPDLIRRVVEEAVPADQPVEWTDPDELAGDRRPRLYRLNDGSGYSFDYDAPLNGRWSDVTVQFEFLAREHGFAVVLHDLHVL